MEAKVITVLDLGEDILGEIFSFVGVFDELCNMALTCKTFLKSLRSKHISGLIFDCSYSHPDPDPERELLPQLMLQFVKSYRFYLTTDLEEKLDPEHIDTFRTEFLPEFAEDNAFDIRCFRLLFHRADRLRYLHLIEPQSFFTFLDLYHDTEAAFDSRPHFEFPSLRHLECSSAPDPFTNEIIECDQFRASNLTTLTLHGVEYNFLQDGVRKGTARFPPITHVLRDRTDPRVLIAENAVYTYVEDGDPDSIFLGLNLLSLPYVEHIVISGNMEFAIPPPGVLALAREGCHITFNTSSMAAEMVICRGRLVPAGRVP